MKKSFLVMFAAAGMLAACNNNPSDLDNRLALLEQRVTAIEETNNRPVADLHADHAGELDTNIEPVAQKIEGPAAKFEFQQAEYDFGTVKDGAIVTHTFKFKNTGEAPLIIQNAAATCGCTVPNYSKTPVAVGETGEIQVRFDSSNKPGAQNKTVTITANTDPAITKLTIKGNVEPKAATAGTEGPVRQ